MLNDLIENAMNAREKNFIIKKNIEMKVLSEFKQLFSNASELLSK